MTIFDRRSEAFQRQFAREEELRFMARARRDKLFGLWIAGKLGLGEDAAADYALTLVLADMEAPGDKDVILRALTDLAHAGIAAEPNELRCKLGALGVIAMEQVRAGVPSSEASVA
jgi:hypothetical protein